MKCVRVATAAIPLTENRAEAEKQADLAVIGTHAAQKAAKYAKEGDYEKAQMEARAAKRFMDRNFEDSEERVQVFLEFTFLFVSLQILFSPGLVFER